FATYSATLLITNLLASGVPLGEVQQEAEHGLAFARQARFALVVDAFMAQLSLIRTLRGPAADVSSDGAARPDESWLDQHLTDDAKLNTWWYWIRKLQARFYAADYAAALEAATKVRAIPWTTSTFFEVAEYHFYAALARAASYDVASEDERRHHVSALVAHGNQLAMWAQHCPSNFEHRAALVAAELARIEGRALDAERLYEDAIRSARANAFVHHEALAYERAAMFYEARGFDRFAELYLRNAR